MYTSEEKICGSLVHGLLHRILLVCHLPWAPGFYNPLLLDNRQGFVKITQNLIQVLDCTIGPAILGLEIIFLLYDLLQLLFLSDALLFDSLLTILSLFTLVSLRALLLPCILSSLYWKASLFLPLEYWPPLVIFQELWTLPNVHKFYIKPCLILLLHSFKYISI